MIHFIDLTETPDVVDTLLICATLERDKLFGVGYKITSSDNYIPVEFIGNKTVEVSGTKTVQVKTETYQLVKNRWVRG